MSKISKLILPIISATVLVVIYYIYFAPSKELGSFSKFGDGSDINQQIKVSVVKEKDFKRDAERRTITFYAKDKNNIEIKIIFHEPAPENFSNAEIVELMGHMHGSDFTAASVSVIK